jgi:hypothetical protein
LNRSAGLAAYRAAARLGGMAPPNGYGCAAASARSAAGSLRTAPEAAPVPAVALARPARPVVARTLAEATTDFTTALARDALTAYS